MTEESTPAKVRLGDQFGPVAEATPLLARLRAVDGWRLSAGMTKASALREEAADEIERLTRLHTAALSFMRGLCADMPGSFAATVAEWDRLHPGSRMGPNVQAERPATAEKDRENGTN